MARWIRPLGILIAVLLVGGGAGLALRSDGPGDYKITAYFEKAIGLFPNSDVNILGVPVGKVTSVEPVGSRVKVDMRVSREYPVPADAFAQIVPISVIADRFVQLHPPYTGSGPTLEDGAVLDTDRTQIPAELDDVFKQLKKLLDAIEPGKEGEPGALGSLIVELNEALADREEDLKGTITGTATLTGTLADAQDNLSGLLVNLDELFQKLALRANSIGSLNENFALVMAALAESRVDLEETLANLADMTGEVGRVVHDNRFRLGDDLRLAANVLETILDNRSSVEESLSWLPVVAIGLSNAFHEPPYNDIDVRDNQNRLECSVLDDVPDSPVKDALQELCRMQTGEPPPESQATTAAADQSVVDAITEAVDCKRSVRNVRRQLKKLIDIDLPAEVKDGIVDPLERKLRRLARECKKAKALLRGDSLLDVLTEEIGDIPDLDDSFDPSTLTGSAAGSTAVADSGGVLDDVGSWFGDLFDFLGWSR